MPRAQRGSAIKHGRGWQARWYDETGARRYQSGFPTQTEALAFSAKRVAEVVARRRGELLPQDDIPASVDALLDTFLAKHGRTVDPSTLRRLTAELKHARAEFGTRQPETLRRIELEDWRATLSAGSRHNFFRAFRQAIKWGAERGYLSQDFARGISNPTRKRHERKPVPVFQDWKEVRLLARELDPRYSALPIFAVGTGLRPEELFGLHRSDVDRAAGVVRVERRFTRGLLKEGGKTPGSVRAVPLRAIVLEALDSMPRRIDSPILFPAPRGGYLDADQFHRYWAPALDAAGLERRGLYSMRHTFASWAIEAGLELWYLARIMGTSTGQLEGTYAHALQRTDERLRAALDSYDVAQGG
jgi:integrase